MQILAYVFVLFIIRRGQELQESVDSVQVRLEIDRAIKKEKYLRKDHSYVRKFIGSWVSLLCNITPKLIAGRL